MRDPFSHLGAASGAFRRIREPVGPPPKAFPAREAAAWARQRRLAEREAEARKGRGR